MPRPQFTIRTLLWLTLVAAVGFAIGPPLVRNYAPKWGEPEHRSLGENAGELRCPTGRVERIDLVITEAEATIAGPQNEPSSRAAQLYPSSNWRSSLLRFRLARFHCRKRLAVELKGLSPELSVIAPRVVGDVRHDLVLVLDL